MKPVSEAEAADSALRFESDRLQLALAGPSQDSLKPWRDALLDIDSVEFRVGTLPDVGFGCDAQILPAFLAHDRYGGTPNFDNAQTLENLRGDGGPDLIVATPMYGPFTRWDEGQQKARSHIRKIFRASFDEIDRYNSVTTDLNSIDRVLIIVNAMGLGKLGNEANANGLRDALTHMRSARLSK